MISIIRLSDMQGHAQVLKDAGVLKAVEGVGSMPEALDQMKVTPSLWVLPPARSGGPNSAGTAAIRQPIDANYILFLGFKNVGTRWTDQSRAIEDVVLAVEDQFIGWTPDSQVHRPMEFVSSGPHDVNAEAGTYLHAIVLSSHNHVRKP